METFVGRHRGFYYAVTAETEEMARTSLNKTSSADYEREEVARMPLAKIDPGLTLVRCPVRCEHEVDVPIPPVDSSDTVYRAKDRFWAGVQAFGSWVKNDCYYCHENMGCCGHMFVNLATLEGDPQYHVKCNGSFLTHLGRTQAETKARRREMGLCKMDEDGYGPCQNKAKTGSSLCEEHIGVKCSGCGAQAVRYCSMSGSTMCGAPLCAMCDHIYGASHG